MGDHAPVAAPTAWWRTSGLSALAVVVIGLAAYGLVRTQRADLVDFAVYRTAAGRALSAEPLYRPEDGHYQFKYLPFFAVAMTPAALVPREVANAAWTVGVVALLVWVLRRSIALIPGRRLLPATLVWLSLVVLGRFAVKEIAFGQSNLLLAALLVAALTSLLRGRHAAAGALVGVATFVKPYALILVPWLVVTGGSAATIAWAGVVAAGLALPGAWYGWSGNVALLQDWYATVTETTEPNLMSPENISFASLVRKWTGPGQAAGRAALFAAGAAFAAAFALVFARRRVDAPLYLEFGAFMLLVPLLSPQGWDYLLLVAAPAFLVVFDRWPALPGAARIAAAASLAVIGLLIFDLVGRTAYFWLTGRAVMTLAVAGVLITLVAIRVARLA